MARYRAIHKSVATFNPTLPSGLKEASMPVDWVIGSTDDRHLFSLTRAQRDEWWKRFRRLNVPLSMSGTAINDLDFDFNVTRRMLLGGSITDEHDLRKPGMGFLHNATAATLVNGPFEFYGTETINGFDGDPENTATAECTIQYFRKIWEGSEPFGVLHYPMHADGEDIWVPYLHVSINVNVIAGAEYAITIESFGGVSAFNGTFCASHGGGAMALDVHSDGPDLFQPDNLTLAITPDLFFEHALVVDGVPVPKWDANTGVRL